MPEMAKIPEYWERMNAAREQFNTMSKIIGEAGKEILLKAAEEILYAITFTYVTAFHDGLRHMFADLIEKDAIKER